MDPTKILCDTSFNVAPESTLEIIKTHIIPLNRKSNKSKFKVLKGLKLPQLPQDNELSDKFIRLSPDPFTDINAYILASIDMYFNITGHASGILAPQLLKKQTYFLSGNSLGFSEYLNYRNPIIFSYLNNFPQINKFPQVKDFTNFPEDRILLLDGNQIITKVRAIDEEGVDNVIINEDIYDYNILFIALKILKDKGNIILKVNLENKKFIVSIMGLLLFCFKEIYLFKPFIISENNKIFYLIGKNFNQIDSTEVLDIMRISIYSNGLVHLEEDEYIFDYIEMITQLIEEEKKYNNNDYLENNAKLYLNII